MRAPSGVIRARPVSASVRKSDAPRAGGVRSRPAPVSASVRKSDAPRAGGGWGRPAPVSTTSSTSRPSARPPARRSAPAALVTAPAGPPTRARDRAPPAPVRRAPAAPTSPAPARVPATTSTGDTGSESSAGISCAISSAKSSSSFIRSWKDQTERSPVFFAWTDQTGRNPVFVAWTDQTGSNPVFVASQRPKPPLNFQPFLGQPLVPRLPGLGRLPDFASANVKTGHNAWLPSRGKRPLRHRVAPDRERVRGAGDEVLRPQVASGPLDRIAKQRPQAGPAGPGRHSGRSRTEQPAADATSGPSLQGFERNIPQPLCLTGSIDRAGDSAGSGQLFRRLRRPCRTAGRD